MAAVAVPSCDVTRRHDLRARGQRRQRRRLGDRASAVQRHDARRLRGARCPRPSTCQQRQAAARGASAGSGRGPPAGTVASASAGPARSSASASDASGAPTGNPDPPPSWPAPLRDAAGGVQLHPAKRGGFQRSGSGCRRVRRADRPAAPRFPASPLTTSQAAGRAGISPGGAAADKESHPARADPPAPRARGREWRASGLQSPEAAILVAILARRSGRGSMRARAAVQAPLTPTSSGSRHPTAFRPRGASVDSVTARIARRVIYCRHGERVSSGQAEAARAGRRQAQGRQFATATSAAISAGAPSRAAKSRMHAPAGPPSRSSTGQPHRAKALRRQPFGQRAHRRARAQGRQHPAPARQMRAQPGKGGGVQAKAGGIPAASQARGGPARTPRAAKRAIRQVKCGGQRAVCAEPERIAETSAATAVPAAPAAARMSKGKGQGVPARRHPPAQKVARQR